MKQLRYPLIIILALILACNGSTSNENDNQNNGQSDSGLKSIAGERYKGGTLTLNEPEYFSLYPPSIIYSAPFRIASQVFEALVKLNTTTLEIEPSLAESWEVDETGTVYTFKLRKNVQFHDDACFEGGKGRLMVAKDVKVCMEQLCKSGKYDAGYKYVLKDRVLGANDYYNAVQNDQNPTDLTGIQVIDNHTLQITLTEPYSNFLYTLTMPYNYIFPAEGFKKYGEDVLVGTGPFKVKAHEKGKFIHLDKNPAYYLKDSHGNQLPYLDGVNITFVADKDQEIDNFKMGKLDILTDLTTDHIIDILEVKFDQGQQEKIKYQNQRSPALSTYTYEFLCKGSVFEKKALRKAFSFAIDRRLIMNKVLDGEAFGPGIHGFTPPGIEGYDIAQITGYEFNPEKAKKYFKEAGYANGSQLQEIEIDINKSGGRNEAIANEIKSQLKKTLGVTVKINVLSKKEKIDKMKSGKSVFYNREWTADYPSPENFLSLLSGRDVPVTNDLPSYPNTARYKNAQFDALLEQGIKATSLETAHDFYQKAEQLMMEDAPLLILVYPEFYRMLQPYLKNMPYNAMQIVDYGCVWLDEKEFEKVQQQINLM